MTTEELIQQLNVNNWTNSSLITEEKGQDYISICAPFNDEVMEVPVDATNWLNVKLDYFEARNSLTGVAREYVSSLVSQYLNTPIGERKPEKKYRLVLQEDGFDPWVLGYGISSGNWGINNEDWLKGQDYQTRFTDDDLKKIADGDQDMLDRLNALKKEAKDDAC